jgi:hypothetical protein
MKFPSDRIICAVVAITILPQALALHPTGASEVLRIAGFSGLLGMMAYLGAFWLSAAIMARISRPAFSFSRLGIFYSDDKTQHR